jgi:hypothetical protein
LGLCCTEVEKRSAKADCNASILSEVAWTVGVGGACNPASLAVARTARWIATEQAQAPAPVAMRVRACNHKCLKE